MRRLGRESNQIIDDHVNRAADRVPSEVREVRASPPRFPGRQTPRRRAAAMGRTFCASAHRRRAFAWRAPGPSPPDQPLPDGSDSKPGGRSACARPRCDIPRSRRRDTSRRRCPARCAGPHPRSPRRYPRARCAAMCAITFSRPRWLMPSTTCSAARFCAAARRTRSSSGISAGHAFQRKSLPSQVARLQNLLKKFGADQPFENERCDRAPARRLPCRSAIQRRRSVSSMCMNSAPMVPQ